MKRLLAATMLAATTFAASAQQFPSKPIRIIVPYATGGLLDIMARAIGPLMTESMGQPIVVENRPGGSSIIGMVACAHSAPDGHTMCLTIADSLSLNPALFSDLPYNPETDFTPIMNMGWTNNLLVANAKMPFDNYKGMIAYAKANPGKLNWATWGAASVPDLYLQWIKHQAGVNIAGIPYKGAGQGNPAVISGEADITYMGFGAASPFLKSGKIKPIVTVGDRRSRFMPELTTLAEEGGDPGLQGYLAMFGPGRMPKPIAERLNAELAKAVRTPQMVQFYSKFTLEFVENSPEQFAQFTKRDRENAIKMFRAIGIKPTASPSS